MTGGRRRPGRGGDPGPRPLGESLDDVVAGLFPRAPRTRDAPGRTTDVERGAGPEPAGGTPRSPSAAAFGTVFSRWAQLVGPALARHTRPLRLEARTLVVAVDQPAWATQVRVLAPGIVARLTEETGEPLDRLEVVVRIVR